MPHNDSKNPGRGQTNSVAREKKRMTFALVFTAIAAVILLVVILLTRGPKDERPSYKPHARKLNTAGKVMGNYLQKHHPDSRVLLVTRPEKSPAFHPDVVKAAKQGLNAGMNDSGEIIAADGPRFTQRRAERLAQKMETQVRNIDKWRPPLGYWFTPEVLQSIVQRHPECNVVVSMIGIPSLSGQQVQKFQQRFSGKGMPVIAVLHGPIPSSSSLGSLFHSDIVTAAVVRRSCISLDYTALEQATLLSEFEEYHTMITPDNLDEISRRCRKVFAASKSLFE